MNKQQIIFRIQQHEVALRRLGVCSLTLFGSWARGKQRTGSDIDLLYEFEEGQATLEHLMDLRVLLEEILKSPVDLVPAKHISPILARHIGDDTEVVFLADRKQTSALS